MEFLKDFLNYISNFLSNGLVIALLAAVFTTNLNNIHRSFRRFIEDTQTRMFFAKECIFIIEQNKIWIKLVAKNNIPLEIALKHISHLKLMNSTYSSILDDFIFKFVLNYEKTIDLTIGHFIADKSKKYQASTYDTFVESSDSAVRGMNIVLNICQKALKNPRKQFINNLIGASEIQPDNTLKTQEVSGQTQPIDSQEQKPKKS